MYSGEELWVLAAITSSWRHNLASRSIFHAVAALPASGNRQCSHKARPAWQRFDTVRSDAIACSHQTSCLSAFSAASHLQQQAQLRVVLVLKDFYGLGRVAFKALNQSYSKVRTAGEDGTDNSHKLWGVNRRPFKMPLNDTPTPWKLTQNGFTTHLRDTSVDFCGKDGSLTCGVWTVPSVQQCKHELRISQLVTAMLWAPFSQTYWFEL